MCNVWGSGGASPGVQLVAGIVSEAQNGHSPTEGQKGSVLYQTVNRERMDSEVVEYHDFCIEGPWGALEVRNHTVRNVSRFLGTETTLCVTFGGL